MAGLAAASRARRRGRTSGTGSVRALAAHDEDGEGYRTTSGYAVIRSEREKPAAAG